MSLLCLNNGYFATKVKTNSQEFMFESKIRKAIDDYETNTVTLNGIKYVVGDGMNDLELDKTNSIVQKCCVALALKKSGYKSCNVISSLPISTYRNKEARKNYEDMLLSFPEIVNVKLYMEGMSGVLDYLSSYAKKLTTVIDIGGLTINVMLVDDGKLVQDSPFSLNLGSIIINNRIKKALEQSNLCVVHEKQIKYMKDTTQYQTVIKEYMNEIQQELKKHNYPTNIQIRFIGGGALLFKEELEKAFPNCYINVDAQWSNVRGLYKFGEVIFGEENNLYN